MSVTASSAINMLDLDMKFPPLFLHRRTGWDMHREDRPIHYVITNSPPARLTNTTRTPLQSRLGRCAAQCIQLVVGLMRTLLEERDMARAWLLLLLIVGVPATMSAEDACTAKQAFQEHLASLQSEYAEEASRIEVLDATIAQIRAQFPDTREEPAQRAALREELQAYVSERREIYTDLRLRRDVLKETSDEVAKAQRECERSKISKGSAPRTAVKTPAHK